MFEWYKKRRAVSADSAAVDTLAPVDAGLARGNGKMLDGSLIYANGSAAHGVREPLIRMVGVHKAYESALGEFIALKNLNLDIYPGEFVAIVGKSGAGKTTLINMLTGVDKLSAGEVWIDGTPIHQMDENKLALWRGRKLGMIYQSFYLMPSLTLLNNVLLPMDFCGLYKGRQSNAWAMDLLRQVELEDHAHKLPNAISGGQQQRVAIARALANDPAIIVADEPTGRLDSITAELIFGIFKALVERGKTIVMVTHDRSLTQRVSRTIHLADGEIVPETASLPGVSRASAREPRPGSSRKMP